MKTKNRFSKKRMPGHITIDHEDTLHTRKTKYAGGIKSLFIFYISHAFLIGINVNLTI